MYLTKDFIAYLSESLPQLKNLEMNRVSVEKLEMLNTYPNLFKNLKKLSFGSFSTTNHPDRGYMSFLGEDIEEMDLYSFECIISTFAKNIERFKKLKHLTLHLENSLEFRGEFILLLHPTETLVWSSNGIRELILRNKQLTKIVVRRHRPGNETYYAYKYEDLDAKYSDVISGRLNGAQWNINGVAKQFVFSKVEN